MNLNLIRSLGITDARDRDYGKLSHGDKNQENPECRKLHSREDLNSPTTTKKWPGRVTWSTRGLRDMCLDIRALFRSQFKFIY